MKVMFNKILALSSLLFVFGLVFFIPGSVSAANPLVPCGNTDLPPCNFCHLVVLGNNILVWIFGLVFVIFGVIMFIAGFGLVTSGGNQSKLDDAKKKFSNAIIGIIIVFAAWLIVDTLMKALVGNSGEVQLGTNSFGPWHSIVCAGGQVTP